MRNTTKILTKKIKDSGITGRNTNNASLSYYASAVASLLTSSPAAGITRKGIG